uniref:Uncharacterized protein n=1 Tax=Rhizophora mucronata TaxID=61149 RepID=A0A2P2QK20_RHIMU
MSSISRENSKYVAPFFFCSGNLTLVIVVNLQEPTLCKRKI